MVEDEGLQEFIFNSGASSFFIIVLISLLLIPICRFGVAVAPRVNDSKIEFFLFFFSGLTFGVLYLALVLYLSNILISNENTLISETATFILTLYQYAIPFIGGLSGAYSLRELPFGSKFKNLHRGKVYPLLYYTASGFVVLLLGVSSFNLLFTPDRVIKYDSGELQESVKYVGEFDRLPFSIQVDCFHTSCDIRGNVVNIGNDYFEDLAIAVYNAKLFRHDEYDLSIDSQDANPETLEFLNVVGSKYILLTVSSDLSNVDAFKKLATGTYFPPNSISLDGKYELMITKSEIDP